MINESILIIQKTHLSLVIVSFLIGVSIIGSPETLDLKKTDRELTYLENLNYDNLRKLTEETKKILKLGYTNYNDKYSYDSLEKKLFEKHELRINVVVIPRLISKSRVKLTGSRGGIKEIKPDKILILRPNTIQLQGYLCSLDSSYQTLFETLKKNVPWYASWFKESFTKTQEIQLTIEPKNGEGQENSFIINFSNKYTGTQLFDSLDVPTEIDTVQWFPFKYFKKVGAELPESLIEVGWELRKEDSQLSLSRTLHFNGYSKLFSLAERNSGNLEENLKLDTLRSDLNKKINASYNILGFNIKTGDLLIIGPFLIFVLQLYLLLHIRNLVKHILHRNIRELPQVIPWSPLFNTTTLYLTTGITIIIGPYILSIVLISGLALTKFAVFLFSIPILILGVMITSQVFIIHHIPKIITPKSKEISPEDIRI
ncbi:MAG: hypothetical protein HEP71_19915 [Roseivirga sp.]|nr:hypothetical protein [Roseivirga sp.]